MKRSILLPLAMLIVFAAMTAMAQSYSGGSGTYGDPYHIATKADLKYLSENSGEWSKFFIQTADIAFSASDFESGGDFYNSGSGFIPIGTSSSKFNGIYDGGGYAIYNLYINRSSTDYVGFIGYSGGNYMQNINLINVDITGGSYTGGLVGYSTGDFITACQTTGSVTGTSHVGGLIGFRTSPQTMTTSASSCDVTGSSNYVGGLIGYVSGQSTLHQTVTNCAATGSVIGGGSFAGGLLGGFVYTDVTYCYSAGAVSGATTNGGLVGYADALTVSRSFWDQTTSGQSSSGGGGTAKTTTQMQTQSTFTDSTWDFTNTWEIFPSSYPRLQVLPLASGLFVTTSDASDFTTSSATLNGSVNPQGDTAVVRFLYGTTSGNYTDSLSAVPDTAWADSTTTVSVSVTGLSGSTTYYYVLAAVSSNYYTRGNEKSFTTYSELWGSALSFKSSNSTYAKSNDPVSSATDDFTLEAWVKWDGTNTGGVQLIASNGYAGVGGGYGIYLWTDCRLAFLINGLAWRQATTDSLDADTWNHVALVRNSGAWGLYKDGVSLTMGGDAEQAPGANALGFFIGGDSLGYRFNGVIDEVRMSNAVRYTSNFTPPGDPFTSDGSTAALYHLDEGTGSTSADSSGNSKTLTLYNSPVWTGSDNPLAVEMGTMSAEQGAGGVVLRWSTVTEEDNAGWEVERRLQTTDDRQQTGAENWVKIGFVEGAGTSTSPKTYTYTDNLQSSVRNPQLSSVSYRLKQLDRSGSFSYSEEISLNLGLNLAPRMFFLSQNYPNPFNPTTMISYSLETDGPVTLRVFDLLGREVATLVNEQQKAGVIHEATFDASQFTSGIYIARLDAGGHQTLQRMVLLK